MVTLLQIIAIIIIFRLLTIPLRRSREKKLWHQWNVAQERLNQNSSLLFGKIQSIRQKASTGTKAYVTWYRGYASQAIWIYDSWLNYGEYILVTGSEGHGEHHDENVFYISELIKRLPHDSEKCWNKYNKRLEKKQQKEKLDISPLEEIHKSKAEENVACNTSFTNLNNHR